MTRRALVPVALIAVSLALAGCTTAESGEVPDPSVAQGAETPLERDRTDELVAAGEGTDWVDAIDSALETAPGELRVGTSLTDAEQALEVCEAAVEALGADSLVVVEDAEGTGLAGAGNPEGSDCAEL